jgi:hypothetical protein
MATFEVIIIRRGKTSARAQWEGFDDERKLFHTYEEVKAWLKETYGTHRRRPMYVDTKSGETKRIGYVISLGWVKDISHPWTDTGKENKWLQEDWVEIREVTYKYPFKQ